MPELPEVETVRQGFLRALKPTASRPIILTQFKPLRKDLRFPFPKASLVSKFLGQPIIAIERRAKYLLFRTEGLTLLSHLGMTGSWRKIQSEQELKLHDHLLLKFNEQALWVYNDPRRFGFVEIFQGQSKFIEHLGPEPLSNEFTPDYLMADVAKAKRTKSPIVIKNWLMNQKNVVGVGNIYCVEALFLAKIKPQRRLALITMDEAVQLVKHIKATLKLAIEKGGSSISDFINTEGESGSYQDNHQVYGRENQPCVLCQTPIKNKVINGRASCYCSQCQK